MIKLKCIEINNGVGTIIDGKYHITNGELTSDLVSNRISNFKVADDMQIIDNEIIKATYDPSNHSLIHATSMWDGKLMDFDKTSEYIMLAVVSDTPFKLESPVTKEGFIKWYSYLGYSNSDKKNNQYTAYILCERAVKHIKDLSLITASDKFKLSNFFEGNMIVHSTELRRTSSFKFCQVPVLILSSSHDEVELITNKADFSVFNILKKCGDIRLLSNSNQSMLLDGLKNHAFNNNKSIFINSNLLNMKIIKKLRDFNCSLLHPLNKLKTYTITDDGNVVLDSISLKLEEHKERYISRDKSFKKKVNVESKNNTKSTNKLSNDIKDSTGNPIDLGNMSSSNNRK